VTDARGREQRATVTLDESAERCRWRSPSRWRRRGTIRLVFRGTLNDKLRGFYRSVYKDRAACPHDGRHAVRGHRRPPRLPVLDEPAFKAVFSVTLVIDPRSPPCPTRDPRHHARGGRMVVRFADSIKMSTYLVAFVVGELEATDPVLVDRRR